jgi:DNA-directed RNA polymerase subunit H (RpoH/RPB5)
MDSKQSYIKQIYNSRLNMIEYLKDMGFDCSDYENFSIEEIEVMKNHNQLNFKVENENSEACYVMYKLDTNLKQNMVKKNNVETFINEIFEENVNIGQNDTLVIITTEYSQDSIHKIIKNIWENESKYVVIMTLANLQFNILKHTFVPKHIKLNEEEKAEFYKKYNIQNDLQIPEISRFDPVAKIIFLRPGDICKIIRYDKISLMNEFYRICVS